MFFNRPWKIITAIALAQLAIVACYLGATTGDAAPVPTDDSPVKAEKAFDKAGKKQPAYHVKSNRGPKLLLPDNALVAKAKDKKKPVTPVLDESEPPSVGPKGKELDSVSPKSDEKKETKTASDFSGAIYKHDPVMAPPTPTDAKPSPVPDVRPVPGIETTSPEKPASETSPKQVCPANGPETVCPPDPLASTAVPPTPPRSDATAPTSTPCPWNLRMVVVDGKTHLTAQVGHEVHFKVVCDQLNLQAPRGSIEAQGCVKLSSSGLEGCCEHLSINWQEDQVVLVGQAQLKCHREGQDMELKSDRLSLRLSPSPVKKAAGHEGSRKEARKNRGKNKRPTEGKHSVSLLPSKRGL
jgi:hypothetical protein